MKNSFLAVSTEIETGKYIASVQKISHNVNLINHYIVKNPATKTIQLCDSRKEAAYIVNKWNEAYKNNGSLWESGLLF